MFGFSLSANTNYHTNVAISRLSHLLIRTQHETKWRKKNKRIGNRAEKGFHINDIARKIHFNSASINQSLNVRVRSPLFFIIILFHVNGSIPSIISKHLGIAS